jgi:TPR repeat protein
MIRLISLPVIVGGLLWLGLNNISPLRHTTWSIVDRFDGRPARTILFLGHSRVYYNNMPDFVRGLADSANAPEKYQITMRALPGATLERLWKDAEVQRLLEEKQWDDVIIQGEAGGLINKSRLASFLDYGERLIGKARQRGARASIIVQWNYGSQVFKDPTPELMDANDRALQNDHRALADLTGAGLMNSGMAWRILSSAEPSIHLDKEDGVHPTLQGSYLSALTIFACLSGTHDFRATYAPWGLQQEQALRIRKAMASSPAGSMLCRDGSSNNTTAQFSEANAKENWSVVLQRVRPEAEKGDPAAQTMIGLLNYFGHGVPQDYSEARRWYELAAEQGSVIAEANLADIYGEGRGVAVDRAKAAKLWRRAALQGHTVAMANLGEYYFRGEAGYPDKCKAYDWWRKAAAIGGGLAQNHLSRMFMTGDGIHKSKIEAFIWATLAAKYMEAERGGERMQAVQRRAHLEKSLLPRYLTTAEELIRLLPLAKLEERLPPCSPKLEDYTIQYDVSGLTTNLVYEDMGR